MIKGFFFLSYNIAISLYYFFYFFVFCFIFLISFYSKKNTFRQKKQKLFPSSFFKKKYFDTHTKKISKNKNTKIDFWIHAVSAGELKLAKELVLLLGKEADNFLITYTSKTAKLLSEKLFPSKENPTITNKKEKNKISSPRIFLQETPIDFLPAIYTFVKNIKPKKFICIEHDVWPNTLWSLKQIDCSRTIVNFFLKPKDFYYYSRFSFVFKWVYDFDLFLLQNKKEISFLKKIGLLKPFHYLGNLKFSPPFSPPITFKKKLQSSKKNTRAVGNSANVIVLGSSHRGEEKIILEFFKETLNSISQIPDQIPEKKSSTKLITPPREKKKNKLIIIPRHLERLSEIKKEIEKTNLPYQVIKNAAEIKLSNNNPQIYLVNSMGEMLGFYALADLILIGDTFLPSQGGHNFVEALPYNAMVFYGEYMCNYPDFTEQLEKEKACVRLKKENLKEQLLFYLNNLKERQKINKKGNKAFETLCFDSNLLREMLSY